MGLVLALFALAWIRIATLLFALFFGAATPPLAELFEALFLTRTGAAFLAVGTAAGALLAFAAFAVSAISVPMIVDRRVDVLTAVAASLAAVRASFPAMMLWAWLIAALVAAGVATLLAGIVVAFPLIGHATWHCYRGVAEDPAAG